jgi:membrane protein required for beta-lactamase induction
MMRRFCAALFWLGLGVFVGAHLSLALVGHQLRAALARETAAFQAKHEAEARAFQAQHKAWPRGRQ